MFGRVISFVFLLWTRVTTKNRISGLIRSERDRILSIAAELNENGLQARPRIKPMVGLSPDMLDWSAAMTLRHLALTNPSIAAVTATLAAGRTFDTAIDYANDFTPEPDAGAEQIDAFRESVDAYLETLPAGSLRGPRTFRHIAFGLLDGHGAHGLFAAHLHIHRKQLERIAAVSGA